MINEEPPNWVHPELSIEDDNEDRVIVISSKEFKTFDQIKEELIHRNTIKSKVKVVTNNSNHTTTNLYSYVTEDNDIDDDIEINPNSLVFDSWEDDADQDIIKQQNEFKNKIKNAEASFM